MSGTAAVRAIMLMATVLWAWAEVLKTRRPGQVEPARSLWTGAMVLTLVHAALAFEVNISGVMKRRSWTRLDGPPRSPEWCGEAGSS